MSLDIKYYNPKSHAPSVFIPAWLIQIPIKELPHGAKLLYGRLAQWSNNTGDVHRSASQLAEELGCSTNTIDSLTAKLKAVKLITTYRAEVNGVNHFKFLDHEMMYRVLVDCLDSEGRPDSNKSKKQVPPNSGEEAQKQTAPPNSGDRLPQIQGIGSPESWEPKVKEVKEVKNNIYTSKNKIAEDFKKDELSLYDAKSNKPKSKSLALFVDNNPHNLNMQLIKDWLEVRKVKKAPLTQTVMNKLNKELDKCVSMNIDVNHALETAIMSNWTGFKAEWIANKDKKDEPLNDESHDWLSRATTKHEQSEIDVSSIDYLSNLESSNE